MNFKIISSFPLLLIFPAFLCAQLPLRHYISPVKGPVLKTEQTVYKDVQLDAAGIPLLPKKSESRVVVAYENGRPVTQTHYDFWLDEQEILSSRTEFSYENGRLKTVKEFVNSGYGYSKQEKIKLHATFIHNYVNGVLESENVLDEDGKLLATLKYLPDVQLGATPLIQFDEYRFEKGELQKRDRYGVQYDTSGRIQLHFQIRNSDTVFYRQVTFRPPDTWRMEYFTASTRLLEAVTWKTKIQYDASGNELLMITGNPEDSSATRYAVVVYRYQYAGDKDWSSTPRVGAAPATAQPLAEKTPETIVVDEPAQVKAPKEVPGDNQISSGTDPKPAAARPPKYFFPYTRIEENGKFGCKDAYGRKIIPAVYDEVDPLPAPQGTIYVRQGKLWGAVDPENRPLLPIAYAHLGKYGKMLFLRDSLGKMGAALMDGTRLIPCENDFLNWDGYLKALYVEKDGLVSLFDQEGRLLLAPKYRAVRGSMHRDDIWAVRRTDDRWGVIDRATGQVIVPFDYEELNWIESLMNRNGEKVLILRAQKNGVSGIIDLDNQTVVPFEYQWAALSADKEHFLVKQNNRLGLLRQDLSVAIPIRYVQIFQPNENIYMPLNEQGLYGARTAEREIVPEKYQREDIKVTGRVIQVKQDSLFWLYAQKGEFEPFQYTHGETFADRWNAALVYHLPDGRQCLVSNQENDPVIEFFDQQTTYEQGRGKKIVVLQRSDADGKTWYGIRNAYSGKCIVPVVYAELDMNVALRHNDQFTRAKGNGSEYACALGRTSPGAHWVLIGSEGSVVALK